MCASARNPSIFSSYRYSVLSNGSRRRIRSAGVSGATGNLVLVQRIGANPTGQAAYALARCPTFNQLRSRLDVAHECGNDFAIVKHVH